MLHYIYDGSFEGILTAVFDAFYNHHEPDGIYQRTNYQPVLDAHLYTVVTSQEKMERVYKSIRQKISSEALEVAYNLYLSEDPEAATCIYHFLKLGWKLGSGVSSYLQNDWVRKTMFINQKVQFECHRMLGLLRFELMENGVYYAEYTPDHNITGLIASHFEARLADQNWIIHDKKRKVCAVYNQEQWVLTSVTGEFTKVYDDQELHFQALWKKFFKAIAIEERKNPKLQRQHMPLRYWKHLTEVNSVQ